MAKLKGPFLSLDASGSIGKAFAVSHWKGQKKAIKHFKPKNPRTAEQQDNRSVFAYAIQGWQSLEEIDKESYRQSVKNLGLQMSGYNYYLQTYLETYGVGPPPPSIVTDGLTHWWKMDEGAGDNISDSVGALNGTRSGAGWVGGKSGSALHFTNVDYVEIANNFDVQGYAEITIEAWINRDSPAGPTHNYNPAILANGGDQFIFIIPTTGGGANKIQLWHAKSLGGWDIHTSNDNVPTGAWHHVVATWDGLKVRFYIDTIPSGESNETDAFHSSPKSETTNIAKYWYLATPCFEGIIDELRTYDKALSLAEIEQNYNIDA